MTHPFDAPAESVTPALSGESAFQPDDSGYASLDKPSVATSPQSNQAVDPAPKSTPTEAHSPEAARLNFLERQLASHPDLREAYLKAFSGSPQSGPSLLNARSSGASLPPAQLSSFLNQAVASSQGLPQAIQAEMMAQAQALQAQSDALAANAYSQKVETAHQSVVQLFDRLIPGMEALTAQPKKSEGHKAFLGHLEEAFERELTSKYTPQQWFKPEVHRELVGRLVPIARQLAREMGLLGEDGRLRLAFSPQTVSQPGHTKGSSSAASNRAGYVEPSGQRVASQERPFDRAFREKDTLGMVRALFQRDPQA